MTARGAPRLAPLPKGKWGDDARDALRAAFPENVVARFLDDAPDAMRTPNAIATFLHHPRLAGRFLAYNGVLLDQPALDPRLREIVVLRVAYRTQCSYEWVQHVRLAERLGIGPDEIDAIASGPAAPRWTPVERDLLAATDEMIEGYRVADETWERLAGALDERQLVEVLFVAGTYTCLAMVFNSFGLQLDPELEPVAIPLPELQE